MIKKVLITVSLTTSSLFGMDSAWVSDGNNEAFSIKIENHEHFEPIASMQIYLNNEFGSSTNIAQIIKPELENPDAFSDEIMAIQEDADENDLIPLIPNNASQMQVFDNLKKLQTKYRNAEESDWEKLKKRKYSVACPACKKNLHSEDISALVTSLNRHTNDTKHKNVDVEDLIEDCHKNITCDIVARCIDCSYICKTKYYTIIGAFKSLWTHYKNKHRKALSHKSLCENVCDQSQTKKFLMIRKAIIKKNDN